jgi:hypothetical protein
MKNKNEKGNIIPEHQEAIKHIKEVLSRCLQMLKISHYKDINDSSIRLIEKTSWDNIRAFGNWILCLNAIADSCIAHKHTLSQSETYDFLTVAVATNIEEKKRSKTIDDTIFRIYRDIMANYENSGDKLKMAYPKIIVEIIAILATGMSLDGKRVALYQIEFYYQRRKEAASSSMIAEIASIPRCTSATAASIATIEKKKEELCVSEGDKERIIENLSRITGRTKKELEFSLSKLQRIDIIRLGYLCENYSKLRRYCDMIHGSEEKFKVELQKDIGRKLSYHQLQRAANSVKQAKIYIENVLDGKFKPHGSYGINHVKHNLEYGYQLIGLIQSRRRNLYKR